ncbi:MAG: alpha/beta hydrolase [Candidatus Omnitrophica bacterium]|nr:alpha/beta hydrolase [Candidatus Omnitrophota bacterium]MCA9432624.1 alpha/beta hydrolase [Candidatus Omnitrophota bacterium]
MAERFEIKNPSDDTIVGNVHIPEKPIQTPIPVVVQCHGFKSFKDWGFHPFLSERLNEAGFAAIRFNFSHNGVEGDSQDFDRLDLFEKNTFSKEMEDLEAVLDTIPNLPGGDRLDSSWVAVIAHSRGAAAGVLVGSKHPNVKTLVTWAGISTVHRYSNEIMEAWKKEGKIEIPNLRTGQQMPMDVSILEDLEQFRDKYDILNACSDLKIPLLVVHGDEDETVPFMEGSLLHDHSPRGLRKLQIVPGGTHTFGAEHPFAGTTEDLDEAIRVTLDWLKLRLKD